MRLTQALRAQHLGHMFKKHWMVQGRRTPKDSGAKAILEARNVAVVDAVDFVKPVRRFEPVEFERLVPLEPRLDSTHADWSDRRCYAVDDTNVLLEGVRQAQVLTRTVSVDGLPSELAQLVSAANIPEQADRNVRVAALSANVYDAEQVKLAVLKDPKRPAFVLPREYGISDGRRMRLIIAKLLAECEKLVGRSTTASRQIVHDVPFTVPFVRDGDQIRIGVHAETLITSKRPIQATVAAADAHQDAELPNLFPLKHTISMPTSNIYKLKDHYPISISATAHHHAHTILLHYAPLMVHNVHATPVTDTQLESRSLLKAFAVAAANARARFGADCGDLPQPIVVQSVQTDGRRFHFGSYQLNTLRLDGDDATTPRNVWYSGPSVRLFDVCAYRSGQPVLTDYNPKVLRLLYAFYCNN